MKVARGLCRQGGAGKAARARRAGKAAQGQAKENVGEAGLSEGLRPGPEAVARLRRPLQSDPIVYA
ncbi:MAG TPA: hypothetical protein VMV57_02840 [Terracidiphilus sp.]|nr:hypothetical protein [Terracidiphilus sp.]